MNSNRTLALLGLALAMHACTVNPVPPPVVDIGDPQPPVARDEPRDAGPSKADATAATDSLLAAAQTASRQNNHTTAISYLERAVRLDPRNAGLWLHLSEAHLADNNLAAATQHARKALALGSRDPDMTRKSWLQLADIKEAEGNKSEADAIRRQYRSYRG